MSSINLRPPSQHREWNTEPCGGLDNVNDGCQMVFPRMQNTGKLCFLCTKLQDPAISIADKKDIRNNYVQCGQCGICGTTVTDPCGTCRRAENDKRGGSDYDREQSAQRRRANLDAKFQRSRPDGTELVGTAVSLEEMQTIRATQGFASTNQRTQVPHCTVYYECRRSDAAKHIDQMLGTGVIFFPEVNTMLALRSRILKEVNGRWTEFYSASLLEEETSLRAPNNYVFPSDSLIMTVAHWYQVYSRPEFRDTYIVLPKQCQRKGKTNSKTYAFSVELYINVGQYTARTEDPELLGVGRAGTKRKTSATQFAGANTGSQGSKRFRDVVSPQASRQTLRSLFVGDGDLLTQTPAAISVVEVRFKKTTCLISEGSGTPTLMEESTTLSGFLETKPLDLSAGERGSTKDVFGLRIGNQAYVAKKLVNVGGGRSEEIPISKAIAGLTADLIRIKRMAYFAEKFKTFAYAQGIDIAEFNVSEAFLIKMYKSSSASLAESVGNGDDDEDHAHAGPTEEVSEVYLAEPLRLTTTVVKFSGTLGSTTRSDLRSLTVTAYSHYVAQQMACRYVFADIQGSNNSNESGRLSLTLFDPMTHTVEGTSGIGDHGLKGLQDFISSHTCNHICNALQLSSVEVLQNTLDDLLEVEDANEFGETPEAA